ncbi:MAG: hypothetical protein LQ351_004423, partial [Letrouitia transgressa]
MPRRAHDPRHAVVSNEHYLVGRHEAHPADIVRHDAVSDAEGQEEHGEEEIEENSQGGGEVRGEFEDKGSGEVGGEEELCVWDGGLENTDCEVQNCDGVDKEANEGGSKKYETQTAEGEGRGSIGVF